MVTNRMSCLYRVAHKIEISGGIKGINDVINANS